MATWSPLCSSFSHGTAERPTALTLRPIATLVCVFWNKILYVIVWTFIRQALEEAESFPFQGVFDIILVQTWQPLGQRPPDIPTLCHPPFGFKSTFPYLELLL